jgi:hypothetical protein
MELPARTQYTAELLGGTHQGPPRFRVETECVTLPRYLIDSPAQVGPEAARLYLRFAVAAAFGLGVADITRDYGCELAWIWTELELAGWVSDPEDLGVMVLHRLPPHDWDRWRTDVHGPQRPRRSDEPAGRRLEYDRPSLDVPVWLVLSKATDLAVYVWCLLALVAEDGNDGASTTLDQALDSLNEHGGLVAGQASEACLELAAIGGLENHGDRWYLRTDVPPGALS